MVNYLEELANKPKRWWGFWAIAPLLILTCLSMTLVAYDREGQTGLGRALVILCDVAGVLLVLGLWDARRFFWCFRLIGLLVFLAYGWYIYDEVLTSDKPFFGKTHQRGEASPINSLLGFAFIGIPALLFAVKPSVIRDQLGKPSDEPVAENDETPSR